MAADEFKNNNDSGQAIFEFLIFIPFLMLAFSLLTTFGNSLNGSINQQKATRRYFYYLLSGNSTAPVSTDLIRWKNTGLMNAGMSSVGWREKSQDQVSWGNCYATTSLLRKNDEETCEAPKVGETGTDFIRVFTFYGICGESYSTFGNNHFRVDHLNKGSSSCQVR